MSEASGNLKKLIRGLEDLSPLFQSVRPPAPAETVSAPPLPRPSFGIQFTTVCCPDHEGDSFLANAYLASELARQATLFASIVSIAPGYNTHRSKFENQFPSLELLNPRISRLVLSHQMLWNLTQGNGALRPLEKFSEAAPKETSHLVLLDFEPSHFRSLARISLLIDRMIFFVQPTGDGLREAYRMMKVFWNLNRQMDFFLLFRGRTAPSRLQGFFFERFSLITSRFLGFSPAWLGSLAFPEKKASAWPISEASQEFHAVPLLSGEGLHRPLSPEKIRFWNWFTEMFKNRYSERKNV